MSSIVWDSLAKHWQRCFKIAFECYRSNQLPIGALITDMEGKEISVGYNHAFEKYSILDIISGCILGHAETNAFAKIPMTDIDHPMKMYVTTEPCPMCFGAMNVARIKELHFACYDPWAGATELDQKCFYMTYKPIHIFRPEEHPLLEFAAIRLLGVGLLKYVGPDHQMWERFEGYYHELKASSKALLASETFTEAMKLGREEEVFACLILDK